LRQGTSYDQFSRYNSTLYQKKFASYLMLILFKVYLFNHCILSQACFPPSSSARLQDGMYGKNKGIEAGNSTKSSDVGQDKGGGRGDSSSGGYGDAGGYGKHGYRGGGKRPF